MRSTMRRILLVLASVGVVALVLSAPMLAGERGSRREDAERPAQPRRIERAEPPVRIARPERPERPGAEPEILVLRFENIPAESFMNTLEQLAHNDRLGPILSQVPRALNREANAVVVVVPPLLADRLRDIAAQLDEPTGFHERAREMGMRERQQDPAMRRMGREADRPGPEMGPPQEPTPGGPMMRGPRQGQMRGPMAGRMQGRMRGGQMMPGGPGSGPEMGPPQGPMPGGPMLRGPMAGRMQGRMRGGQMMPGGPGSGPEMGPPQGPTPGGPMAGRMQGRMRGGQMMPGGPGSGPEMGPPQGPTPGGPMAGRMQGRMQGQVRGQASAVPPRPERPGRPDLMDLPGLEPAERFMAMTEPDVVRKLRLSEAQVDKIRLAVEKFNAQRDQMRQRVRDALEDLPPDERAQEIEKMKAGVKDQHRQMIQNLTQRVIEEILKPDQREAATRWLKARGLGQPPQQEAPRPARPARPERPARRGMPSRPAVAEEGPTFRLIAEGGPREGGRGRLRDGGPGRGGPGDSAIQNQMRLFRLLDDPDVRRSIGLAPEQDEQLKALQEKAKATFNRAMDQAKLDRPAAGEPDQPPGDERARERRGAMGRAMREALSGVRPELEALMKTASDLLTPDQADKLKAVDAERAKYRVFGNLFVLTTRQAKEELGLAEDQQTRIKQVLKEFADRAATTAKSERDAVTALPETERGEAARSLWQKLRAQQADLAREARRSVFALLTEDQKKAAERLLEGLRPERPDRNARPGAVKPEPKPESPPAPVTPVLDEQPVRFLLVAEGPGEGRWGEGGRGVGGLGALGRLITRADGLPMTADEIQARVRAMMYFNALGDAEVRKEIGLTPEQDAKMVELHEKVASTRDHAVDQARLDNPSTGGGDENLERERQRAIRRAQFEALIEAFPSMYDLMKAASDLLTDEQTDQLKQLLEDRQKLAVFGGLEVLMTEKAKEELKLSDEQHRQIKQILTIAADRLGDDMKARQDAMRQQWDDLREKPEADRGQAMQDLQKGFQEFNTKRQDAVKDAKEKVFAVLTPEQKDPAEKMVTEAGQNRGRFGAFGGLGLPGGGGGPRGARPAPAAPAPPAPQPGAARVPASPRLAA